MDSLRLDLPVAVTLRVQSRSGKVDLIAEPRDDVEVEGDRIETMTDDGGATLRVRAGKGHKPIKVRCPITTDVVIGTMSGSVRTTGHLGQVSITTMSGSVDVDHADELDVRTASGSIRVGDVPGRCRMQSSSGSVRTGRLGAAAVQTMSGSVEIEHVERKFRARTVSGSIVANAAGEGPIQVQTVSGKVHIGLPPGTTVQPRFKTISGRVRCALSEGHDCQVDAMTVSGSIELEPA